MEDSIASESMPTLLHTPMYMCTCMYADSACGVGGS